MKKLSKFVSFALTVALLTAACSLDETPPGDTNYSLQGKVEKGPFTVTWKNWDGAVLETDKNVDEGTMPEYNGETPTREGSGNTAYTFSKWSPTVAAVTTDVTYTATFTSESGNGAVIYEVEIPDASAKAKEIMAKYPNYPICEAVYFVGVDVKGLFYKKEYSIEFGDKSIKVVRTPLPDSGGINKFSVAGENKAEGISIYLSVSDSDIDGTIRLPDRETYELLNVGSKEYYAIAKMYYPEMGED